MTRNRTPASGLRPPMGAEKDDVFPKTVHRAGPNHLKPRQTSEELKSRTGVEGRSKEFVAVPYFYFGEV